MASTATTLQAESAYGPEPPLGTMEFNMDDVSQPIDSVSRRQPNPPFVFPRRASDAGLHSDRGSPPPLPTFSFNPGKLHAPSPSTSALAVPRPGGGHRRRPSELIGGEGPPSPHLLSSSPRNSDMDLAGSLPPPSLPAPGGPPRGPGRRGHAHRRSQAMSSMDLTAMTKAVPPILTVGSAPTSPADNQHTFQDNALQPLSRSAVSLLPNPTPPKSPVGQPDEQDSNPTNNTLLPEPQRPRPVSMISNETTSTLSTVRPGHSRVNSATPVATPTETDKPSQKTKVRPKTADAASLTAPQQVDRIPFPDLPLFRRSSLGNRLSEPYRLSSESTGTTSIKSKAKKKKTKKNKKKSVDCDGDKEDGKPSLEGSSRDPSSDRWESASSTLSQEDPTRRVRRSGKKHNREQKVRSWAGAIFPLKSKRTQVRKAPRRSPTPPPILTRTNSDMGSIEVDFDADNTVIIRTPTNPNAPVSANKNPTQAPESDTTFETAWKPRSFYEQTITDDTFSPVIDLDAALGPFNTPEMSSNCRIAGSAFSQATKHMYSGGRRGEFIGPEMRYHRRAESAPEMPPIDRSALGFPRFGSEMTMAHADVFYEEEEDAFLAENRDTTEDDDQTTSESADDSASSISEDEVQPSSSDTLRIPTQDNAARNPIPSDDGLGIHVAQRSDVDAVLEDGPGDAILEDHPQSDVVRTASNPIITTQKSVEIFEPDQWLPPRTQYADSPDVSPRMLPLEKRPCSSPHDFSFSLPQLSFPSRKPSSSAFPSPDPSNMSFDGPHSATASSLTDQTTFNHPSYDHMQCSAEDIPSLSSSASTKTNSRGRFSSGFYTRTSAERPMSYNNYMAPPRSSHSMSAKRNSLVSLSRFVSGPYGEKSKLRHEEKPPADEAEACQKKSNRMSRLMFWRTRDKSKTRADSK